MSDATGGGEGCPAVHVHNHVYPSDKRMEQALKLLRQIIKDQHTMAVTLQTIQDTVAALEGKVAEQKTVQESAVTLLGELSGMVAEVSDRLRAALDNGSDEEVQAQLDRLAALGQNVEAQSAALAAAIEANTPAAEPPQPAPPAEEPTA